MNSTLSVVMTTYADEHPNNLRDCFYSISEQQRKPDEVIIVRGHELPSELVQVITEFDTNTPFTVHDIPVEEQGRGNARKIGVEEASSDLIAIIDSDDIACPKRFSKQIEYLHLNPSVDVVGGYIGEFETTPDEIETVREEIGRAHV